MANPGVADSVLHEALRVYEQCGKSQRAAAQALGWERTTFRKRLERAKAKGISLSPVSESEIEIPNLPSSELEPAELVEQACKEFARQREYREARRWFEIKTKSSAPIGVSFIGDPHIDNPGANWPLLREHIRLLENTPGLYAVNAGDLTDNWCGRLIRLYADSKMSKKQAWKLAAWFLKGTKVKWLCHVLGNHDQWGDGAHLIKANATVPVEDWQARFQIVFPNGRRIRVHCAHDFPGHSQWNHLHGAQKQAMWGEHADLYVCGHKHCWAIHQEENAHRGFIYHLIRCRGYKFIDSYADNHGFGSQRYGASVTVVIDPSVEGPNSILCFPEMGEAAEFLTWKRSRT